MSIGSGLRRVGAAIWRGLDWVRKVLHFILLLSLLLIVLAVLVPRVHKVPGQAALVIDPRGALVEQLSGDPFQQALARARGLEVGQVLLKDLIDAIRAAKDDNRIKALVLELDGMQGAGLSKLQALAGEIASFKQSGKRVIAFGDNFDRDQYYLAAQADDVYMNPMGNVLIGGYGRFLPYYKSAIDKLYIDYNVWKVGKYKSFVEPITRDDMSPADREASTYYLDGLWDAYQKDVTAARELPAGSLQRYADQAPDLLKAAGGDSGKMAVDFGLVDELLTRDEARKRIADLVGPACNDNDDFEQIDYKDYLAAVRERQLPGTKRDKVGVIVASGEIRDGMQPAGTIGGDSMVRLIRRATQDQNVKALVLRVDSPGGSAFASGLILRALQVFQKTGRPLVVSMSSVAASGGYWISMSGDQIWASPTTLTGSIGVGATVPTFQNTLAHLGVHVDGVGTTKLSGAYQQTRALGDNVKAMIDESIHYTYGQFVAKVARNRGMSVDAVEKVAGGRVWTGKQAMDRGLVDKLGTLDDAIRSAAQLAKLKEGQYRVSYIAPQLTFAERVALRLAGDAAPLADAIGLQASGLPEALQQALKAATEPLGFLKRFNDPHGIYAYCFCDVQ